MQESMGKHFIEAMARQLAARSGEGVEAVMMDLRDEGIDFYAVLGCGTPLKYFCRGIRYAETPEGTFTMEAANGTVLEINEREYRDRLDYALSCIEGGTENAILDLVVKHAKGIGCAPSR